MIENFLSVQDVMALGGLLFLAVKWIQRKEGWGWENNNKKLGGNNGKKRSK